MPDRRLYIPRGGASNAASYVDQRLHTVPLGALGNVTLYDRDTDRPRIGTRWGVRKRFPLQLGNGLPVQSLVTAEAISATTGLRATNCRQLIGAGESRAAGPIAGHCFVMDRQLSMMASFTDARTAGDGAFNCAWHATDPDRLVYQSIFADGGYPVSGLTMVDVSTRTVLWQALCEDKDTPAGVEGTTPILSNAIHVGEVYTFVAARNYVYVFNSDTGAFIRRYNCEGWAAEVMRAKLDPDGRLLACFWGTGAAGALPNQAIVQDVQGSSHMRSGVMRFAIVADAANPLRLDPFAPALASTAPWFESVHGYLRLSEVLGRAPRGAIPYAFDVGPDGEFAVGFTNQGWGWTTGLPPDGTKPYTVLAMFSPNGTLLWERDTASIRRPYTVGASTYYNDIPVAGSAVGTPNPAANAVCFDLIGDIYVGGEPNDVGANVFKFNSSGDQVWSARMGGLVEQHAMQVDPTDNNLWVAVLRNDQWTGAAGRFVQLVKLASDDGRVLLRMDLNRASIDPFQLAVNSRGDVAFVTDYTS